MAARDFSQAGEIFIDHQGQANEILYSVLTPLGYRVLVSAQKLRHAEKHAMAAKHKTEISHTLNNPDLVTINHDEPDTHIFYKFLHGKLLLVIPVQVKSNLRFLATMYNTDYIKGLKQNLISPDDFLYVRGGFKWKKWK